jgi:hypothetical protein
MAQESPNPFILPGFGQQGEAAGNPLFAGLEMMRQAWQNLAGAGHLDVPAMPSLSPEDLDRRIRELQTVQNWLQLNATMLANTIQGLEIQRSTLKTLQAFAGGAFPGMAPAGDAKAKRARASGSATKTAAQDEPAGQAYAKAAGDWWNLVQQQFEQLREATTASLGDLAEAAQAGAAPVQPASKPARGGTRPAAGKATAAPRKPAARKAPASRAASTRKPRAR